MYDIQPAQLEHFAWCFEGENVDDPSGFVMTVTYKGLLDLQILVDAAYTYSSDRSRALERDASSIFSGRSILCDRTALVGTTVRVNVLLPDHSKTLSIEGGRIKWAEGRLFGMEFLRLPLEARKRLDRTLRRRLSNTCRPTPCKNSNSA